MPPLYTKAASLSLSGLSHPLLVPPRISHFPATFLLLWRQKPEAAAKMQTQSWLLKVGKEGERSEERGKQVGVKRKKRKNLHRAQHMCVQKLASNKNKAGKYRGGKALGMVGKRNVGPT